MDKLRLIFAAAMTLLVAACGGPSPGDAERSIREQFELYLDADNHPPFSIFGFEVLSTEDRSSGATKIYSMKARYKISYNPPNLFVSPDGTKRLSGLDQIKAHGASVDNVLRFFGERHCREIVPADGAPTAPYTWQCPQDFKFTKSDAGWKVDFQ